MASRRAHRCSGSQFFPFPEKSPPFAAMHVERYLFSLRDLRGIVHDSVPVWLDRKYTPIMHYYFPQSRLFSYSLRRDGIAATCRNIAATLEPESAARSRVMLILDHEDEVFTGTLAKQFSIDSSRTLFISQSSPHAVCYSLSAR